MLIALDESFDNHRAEDGFFTGGRAPGAGVER